ncbi:MAG: TPM domain-containing protein [Acholeplasmataceae bacterium]|nr:TPM domain-containing protein [Acholeplasmataceae bacterium]
MTSMRTKFKTVSLFLVVLCLTLLFSGCQKDDYPRPTRAFYCNDFANILYGATKEQIILEGEDLYEQTKDLDDGGAQLVIATFEVAGPEEIAEVDKTELYRSWEIGDNDMGLLVILFFVPETIDEIDYLVLEETQVEVGYRMEQYLTPSNLGLIVDETLYSEAWDDLDSAVMHMTYALVEAIYEEAYGDTSYVYDMELFQAYVEINPDGDLEGEDIPMGFLVYLLSPFSTASDRLGAIIGIVFFVFLSGTGTMVLRNRGGGGSSGGAGIFRRRR